MRVQGLLYGSDERDVMRVRGLLLPKGDERLSSLARELFFKMMRVPLDDCQETMDNDIDPKKFYAIRISNTEIEIYREFSSMKEAECMWKDPRYCSRRDFATAAGSLVLKLLERRQLVGRK
jgi:hypothetical protein